MPYSEYGLSHFLNKFFIFCACLFWDDICSLSSLSGNSVIAVDLFFVISLFHSFSFILSFKGPSFLHSVYVIRYNACLVPHEHSLLWIILFHVYISDASLLLFDSVAPCLLPPSTISCSQSRISSNDTLAYCSKTLLVTL